MNYIIRQIEIENKIYNILIGKNACGNEEIIKKANNEDIWFHIDNFSSAHLILQNNGDIIPKRDIFRVANILLEYKGKKVSKNCNIIYTKVKNITLTNKIGTVLTKKTELLKM